MNLYAESSAVLAWLLGEPVSDVVREHLSSAQAVVASDLTVIECDRVLIRAVEHGDISETLAAARRLSLQSSAAHWAMLRIGPGIVERSRQPFPIEPVRTLDAIHLASALSAKSAVPDLALLSLDTTIRRNGLRLGFAVVPDLGTAQSS